MTCDRDGVLRSNCSALSQDAILDTLLDLDNFLDSVLFAEAVKKQVHIAGWRNDLMEVLPQSSLRGLKLLRHRHQGSDDSGTGNNNVALVHISKGRFAEDRKLILESAEIFHNCWRSMRKPDCVVHRHNVSFLLFSALCLEISRTDLDVFLMTCEDRNNVQILFRKGRMIRLLSKDFPELSIVLLVGFKQFRQRRRGVRRNVGDEVRVWQELLEGREGMPFWSCYTLVVREASIMRF